MAVIPVPSNRSSDLLLRSRLMFQLQQHQLEMLTLQNQISTGLRITRPSDDSPAASRAVRLQMMLEQKSQSASNLKTTASFLAASDNAVATVASSLIEIRGLALSVNDTTTPDVERQAAVRQIGLTLTQMTQVGNREFRGRYLFAGSRAEAAPFESVGRYVAYRGNDKTLGSFVDLGLLQDVNLGADQLFGVYSQRQAGLTDLNPILTENLRLADLNGGRGVSKGSFVVSDGASSSTIDISSAVTVGDVIRLIEGNPPEDRKLVARVTSHGLSLELADGLGGNLTVRDLSGAPTAADLGILRPTGVGDATLIGGDLNPILRGTTPLRNIMGVRASAALSSSGTNNDLLFEATTRGAEFNGYRIQMVDDSLLQAAPGVGAGSEFATFSPTAVAARAALEFSGSNNNLVLTANTPGVDYNQVRIEIVNAGAIGNNATVNYDGTTKVLAIGVDSSGLTEVQTVINEIALNSPFTASYDDSLPVDGGYVPTATISAADVGAVTGNTGNSGGDANTIFVHITPASTTANQVLTAINNSAEVSALITARIDSKDTEVADFEGGGIVDATATATLSGGSGVEFDQQSGLRIVNGGQTHTIDVTDAVTVEDLLNAINGAGANVVAEINATASGINVRSILAGSDLMIGENGGETATQLGIRSLTDATLLSNLNHGLGVHRLGGTEFTIVRNDGVELGIDLGSATTLGDVIEIINNHASNQDAGRITARLAVYGNGIELIDETAEGPGALKVVKGSSNAAWDLGFIPRNQPQATAGTAAVSATARLSFSAPNDVNTALAVTVLPAGSSGNAIEIVFTNSGTVIGDNAAYSYDSVNKVLTIDIDPLATTANAVVTAFAASTEFAVALDTSVDATNDGTGILGASGPAGTTSGGVAESLQSSDVNPIEVKGVFNTLVKLADALYAQDDAQVERTMALLLEDLDRLGYGRAEMGLRGQFLDTVQARLDDETVQLRTTLSGEIDSDLVEAISQLTIKQTSMQASLQLIGRTFQLSLLDFI